MREISDVILTLSEVHATGVTPFDPNGDAECNLSFYYTGGKVP